MDLNIINQQYFCGINTKNNESILPFCSPSLFFPRHYFGNLFCFFSYQHYSTIPQQHYGSNHSRITEVLRHLKRDGFISGNVWLFCGHNCVPLHDRKSINLMAQSMLKNLKKLTFLLK
jgi:hypothetical protein